MQVSSVLLTTCKLMHDCDMLQEDRAKAQQLVRSMRTHEAEQRTAHTAELQALQVQLTDCQRAVAQEQGNSSCHAVHADF